MAGYRGHVVGGLCAYGISLYLLKSVPALVVPVLTVPAAAVPLVSAFSFELLLCTMLGSLFPDIDIKSKGQQIVYALLAAAVFVLVCIGKTLEAAAVGLIGCIPLIGKHRGITHNIYFLAVLVAGVVICSIRMFPQHDTRIIYDALFFAAGIVSHLIIDRYG